MVGYLFLGVALLVGLLLIGQWAMRADPKVLVRSLRWVAIGIVAALVVFMAVTGRLAWAFMLLPALLPWFLRLRALARTAKNFQRMAGAMGGFGAAASRPGQSSEVRTRFLDMSLDHETGDLSGTVVEGPHAGRNLDELALAELVELLNQCVLEDSQSAQVLETYLDRNHPDWRERVQAAGAGPGNGRNGVATPSGAMTREEAFEVLGLEPGAGEDEIKAAHHRLIANLHPDRGGSTYLAAKINQAKDALLKRP